MYIGINIKSFCQSDRVFADVGARFGRIIMEMIVEQNEKFSNSINSKNLKEFLTALNRLSFLESYQQPGFTLISICNIGQIALLAETQCKGLTLCHSPLDFYNLLSLVKCLLSNSEWELLDQLNNDY